jgi:hypothetical protein
VDLLVAEVDRARTDADLVLLKRLAGECRCQAVVERLRHAGWQGAGPLVSFLDEDPAGLRAQQPAVHLGDRKPGRGGGIVV